jgi:hypothetical protein
MTTSILEQDYIFDLDTIIEECVIPLPDDANSSVIHAQYFNACRSYFKAEMLSCDYPDYPCYFKEPFKHLYAEPSDDLSKGIFDFDGALEILEQMLEAHISADSDSFTLEGSAIDDSHIFFDKILEIAVTSGIFPVKQFVVQGSEYEGDEHWVTIYECHDGKMKSVYCS